MRISVAFQNVYKSQLFSPFFSFSLPHNELTSKPALIKRIFNISVLAWFGQILLRVLENISYCHSRCWFCSFPFSRQWVVKAREHAALAAVTHQGKTSLVVQWFRISLPIQGTRVRSLVSEDAACHGVTKPVHHNYWACALEPGSRNCWAHMLQLNEVWFSCTAV